MLTLRDKWREYVSITNPIFCPLFSTIVTTRYTIRQAITSMVHCNDCDIICFTYATFINFRSTASVLYETTHCFVVPDLSDSIYLTLYQRAVNIQDDSREAVWFIRILCILLCIFLDLSLWYQSQKSQLWSLLSSIYFDIQLFCSVSWWLIYVY